MEKIMKDKKKQCLLKRKQENDRGCENMFEEDEQVRLTGAGEGVSEWRGKKENVFKEGGLWIWRQFKNYLNFKKI